MFQRQKHIIKNVHFVIQDAEFVNINQHGAQVAMMDRNIRDTTAPVLSSSQLIRCANLVIKEVACEFIPLTFRQIIKSEAGAIPYTKFAKPLLLIKSIKDLNGEVVTAYTTPNYLAIEEGTFAVTYNYIPSDKGFFEDIDFKGDKASDRIFAYGTASEYCLINGDYDNALYWERRYKDALEVLTGKETFALVPKRRWI